MSNEADNAMDPNGLFREENYTDQKMGAIRKLIPVNADGSDDSSRDVAFFGSAQVMTPMGAIPLNFALEGTTIGEAAADFAGKAAIAVDEAAKELERMRREQASQIVVPGQGGQGGMGGAGMQGGGIIT
jgi:hypothetical protein